MEVIRCLKAIYRKNNLRAISACHHSCNRNYDSCLLVFPLSSSMDLGKIYTIKQVIYESSHYID